MRYPQDIAWAMEAAVEHPGLGEELFFQYWIGSMAPGWKATFSPAGGDKATLGVFVRGHGQDVESFFQGFLKRFKAYKAAQYEDIEDLKILSIKRGGDPIATLPGEIVADSLMVTGRRGWPERFSLRHARWHHLRHSGGKGRGRRRRIQKGIVQIQAALERGVLLGIPHG